MKRWLAITAILTLSTTSALAYDVYPGCEQPGASSGPAWWIDPVNGKSPADGGNGSYDKPWNSLLGVVGGGWSSRTPPVTGYTRPLLSSQPYMHVVDGKWQNVADTLGNPPVAPGDTLNLMSGNYGDWSVAEYRAPVTNSKFVIVQAGPGQTPTFSTMYVFNTSKWVFDGLTVKSLYGTNGNKRALVSVADQGADWPTSDIIFANMTIKSMDDSRGLTQAQAVDQLRPGFYEWGSRGDGTNGQPYLTCVSLTNSKIRNTRNGVTLAGNQTLAAGNEIDHFWDDGIVYAGRGVTISKNFIHDNLDAGDGNHEDAMQGQIGPLPSGVPFNKYADILIDSNRMIRQTDPKLTFPTYMQGIDAFDSDWTNVTITNNVLVTSSCHGIFSGSTHNGLFASNTVTADGLLTMPGNCQPDISGGGKTHQGPDSDHVHVANNFAPIIAIDNRSPTVTWGNNVATGNLVNYQNGNQMWNHKPGVDAWNNLYTQVPLTEIFRIWDGGKLLFDVTPAWGSPLIGVGTASGVPAVDILGKLRSAPLTAGAYGYPF